ncbi:MAG TPA: hypothetical protein VJQ55_12440 [Candidatus Binatia bacterium]|nr:hypothetical protein [Candidatus Binatia bacterium]
MNEARALTGCRTRRSRLVFPVRFFLIAALFSGCISPKPKLVPSAPPANFPDVVKRVSAARGLEPKQEIKLAGTAAAANPNAPADGYQGAPVAEVERAYKIAGLLPNAGDFSKALSEYRRFEQLIFYNRFTSTASWTPGAAQMGAPLAKIQPEKAEEFAPVFAIAQALQEQHFKWRAVIDSIAIEDRRSAFQALAIGDAALILLNIGIKKTEMSSLPAQLEVAAQAAGELDKLAASLPDFFRRRLTFPYRHGGLFVYWALRLSGWPGVNSLYRDPPFSTGEILHPERYFIDREAPLHFFPPQLMRRVKEGAVIEQTLGEDAIAGLLSRDRSAKLPADVAAGWRADDLFVFRESNNPMILWFSAWRSEDQAQAFLNAYRSLLETRHRIRFDAPITARTIGAWTARAPDGRGWLLQRNQSNVLLISAVPASRLLELAGEAWKDLQIDKESTEIRYESARKSAQPSARRR